MCRIETKVLHDLLAYLLGLRDLLQSLSKVICYFTPLQRDGKENEIECTPQK